MANVPITAGSGTASVAAETISGVSYQQIEVYGGGGASVLSVNPDGSFKASIVGVPAFTFSNSSIVAVQGGTRISSVVSANPSSMLVGASIFGQLPAGTAPIGSVATLQGTNPWVTIIPGSVISVTQGSVAAATTITSIATANGGIPVWSPLGSRVQGVADFRGNAGASIAVLAGAGASTRNYVDHVQIMNFGSASVLVTLADNTTSVLGYTIAPAGGGSNYDTFYRGAVNSPITASISGQASVLVSMQGFTSGT